jgi:hypothetical protein
MSSASDRERAVNDPLDHIIEGAVRRGQEDDLMREQTELHRTLLDQSLKNVARNPGFHHRVEWQVSRAYFGFQNTLPYNPCYWPDFDPSTHA